MRSQGVTEELKCLSLLNALDKDQDIPEQLAQLFGEPCIKLAEGIKAYISKVRTVPLITLYYHSCNPLLYTTAMLTDEIQTTIITPKLNIQAGKL